MIVLGDHSPKTMNEAVDLIYKNLDNTERSLIKGQNNAAGFHFSFGMSLRNHWGLWTGSELKDYFI